MCMSAEKFQFIKQYFNNVKIIVYFEDFSTDCLFKCKLERLNYKNYVFIKKLNQEFSNDVTSVLIKKNQQVFLLKSQIKMFIEELKHCLKRFENVLHEQVFTDTSLEFTLANIILSIKEDLNESDQIYFSIAREILHETFLNYKNLVDCSNNNNQDAIHDDLKSKIEAWNFALNVNKIFLNIDMALMCSK